jgi:acyl carrier protein
MSHLPITHRKPLLLGTFQKNFSKNRSVRQRFEPRHRSFQRIFAKEYCVRFTLLPMTSSMTSTSTLQHPRATALIQHLSADLRVPGNRLQAFTRLREDLFLDTMDIDLLIASLERNLEYYLTEEEAAQIETVGDLQTFFLR